MNMTTIINRARLLSASDIHLVSGQPPVYRRNGEIRRDQELPPVDNYDSIIYEIMTKEQQQKLQEGNDVDFAYTDEAGCRYRINAFHQMGKSGAVIRLLADHIPDFAELGLPEVMRQFAMLPRGLVLVTGPTGSGKSTSLAAMIDYANKNRKAHIITVEDPIEYRHECNQSIINQREVGRDVDSFATALRSALREDPDIILVGEMRDYETVSAAITAAETGHLVFSTLHTTGAAKTIDRIIDVFPPHQQNQVRSQLASVLRGVVTQQLVKNNEGGRTAAMEVMVTTPAVANLIREGKIHQINSSIQTGSKDGMVLMDYCLANLVNEGVIDREEALLHCIREDDFSRVLY